MDTESIYEAIFAAINELHQEEVEIISNKEVVARAALNGAGVPVAMLDVAIRKLIATNRLKRGYMERLVIVSNESDEGESE